MDRDWQDDFYLLRLKKNRVALVRDILPCSVCDHLLAEDVLSQEEYEMVMYCNETTAGKNRKLLDIVATKGPNGYNELRNALQTDFLWLVELLDNTPRPQEASPDSSSSPPDSNTSEVTDVDLEIVVKGLLASGSLMGWKFLARKLGLTEDRISEIEYRSLRDVRAQIYDMLALWRSDRGGRATVSWLCEALKEEGRLATAEAIQTNHRETKSSWPL